LEGGYAYCADDKDDVIDEEEKKKHATGTVKLLLTFEPPSRTEARMVVKEVTDSIIGDVLALIPQLVPRVEVEIDAIQGVKSKRSNGKRWKPTVVVFWNDCEVGRAVQMKLNPVDLVAGVKRAFTLIDVNGDGKLDRIEVTNGVLQNEEVRTLLKLSAVIDDKFDKWFSELDKVSERSERAL